MEYRQIRNRRITSSNTNANGSSNKSTPATTTKLPRPPVRTAYQASSRPFTRSQALLQNKMKQSMVTCDICFDPKTESEMFRNKNVCVDHVYCSDCIIKHVAEKIKINIIKVTCPDPSCKGVIEPEVCRSILPKEVLDRWENALCESVILESEKFYCPFKDCSAMLVKDSCVSVTSSECPHCHRLFCAQCKVPWHSDLDCNDFEKVKRGEIDSSDLKLMNLAKNNKWMRCPHCKYFVERKEGCNSIKCRCGSNFCYGCGMRSCACTRARLV